MAHKIKWYEIKFTPRMNVVGKETWSGESEKIAVEQFNKSRPDMKILKIKRVL